ncbi:MAG TPA: Arc family DNA-binding protein [Thermoanaerobaculia bacterium]|nr:Arc family DNA-binding protein [Thermoanaerobaculia bacterium]
MPVNLSIKNVPDEVAERLRRRAERSHRSLQGELMTILTEAAVASSERLSIQEARRRVAELGLRMPPESAAMVREDRDAR